MWEYRTVLIISAQHPTKNHLLLFKIPLAQPSARSSVSPVAAVLITFHYETLRWRRQVASFAF